MTLYLFTFRGRFTDKVYYATGHNSGQAAHQVGIKSRDLILEKKEKVPTQLLLSPLEDVKKLNSRGNATLPTNG